MIGDLLRGLPLILCTLALSANTTMGRGVIVKVDGEGDRRGPYIVVRSEYQTPRDGEDALVKWSVPKQAVITLDGRKADFAAFQPGRLVWLCQDCSFFQVFTRSFLFDDATAAADPATAWWTVRLPAGVAQPSSRSTSELVLQLVVADGKVARAVALTPGWSPAYGSSPAWHEVDAKTLEVTEGRLTGACTVTLADRGVTWGEGGAATRTCAVELALAADGTGTASCDGQALRSEQVSVECRPVPAIPDEWYCFLRAPDPQARAPEKNGKPGKPDNLHLEIRRQAGELACPSFRYGYGKPGGGPAATAIEMSVADGKVVIVATGRARQGEVTYTLEGFVLGDRIFGTGRAVNGDAFWDCRFSGYLRQADSPSIGWEEREAKQQAAALKETGK